MVGTTGESFGRSCVHGSPLFMKPFCSFMENNHGLSWNKSLLFLLQGIVLSLGTSRAEQVPAGSHGAWISSGMSISWVTGLPALANKIPFLRCYGSKLSFIVSLTTKSAKLLSDIIWCRLLKHLKNFKNLFYWSMVDLQCCVNFCCTAKWFCDTVYTFFFIFFSIMV